MSDAIESSDTELTDLDRMVVKASNELPSDEESSVTEFEYDFMEFSDRLSNYDLKSPAISEHHSGILHELRDLCDLCMKPADDGRMGGSFTLTNADKQDDLRHWAESTLKFYNDTKLKNFKLVKVCKINFQIPYYGLTFRAQEDGSEECPLFRGAVYCVGGEKAVFCEIKDDDDEVTLLPSDDDYVSSAQSCDSKDSSPFICVAIESSDKTCSDVIEPSDTELTDLDLMVVKPSNELPNDEESSDSEFEFDFMEFSDKVCNHDLKSPAIAEYYSDRLHSLRGLCELCLKPADDGSMVEGLTLTNADKRDDMRDLVELALKFFNDTKLKKFKLVKVCKINIVSQYYGLTFRAQEDGSEECHLFRGAVYCVGEKAVFCEIKDDDEIRLLPSDDDYVSSEQSRDSKDSSPFICKNDPGDGCSLARSDVSEGSLK